MSRARRVALSLDRTGTIGPLARPDWSVAAMIGPFPRPGWPARSAPRRGRDEDRPPRTLPRVTSSDPAEPQPRPAPFPSPDADASAIGYPQPYRAPAEQPYGVEPASAQPYSAQPYSAQPASAQPYSGTPATLPVPYPPAPASYPPPVVYPAAVAPQTLPLTGYGYDPVSGLPYSHKSKVVAGLLQLLLGLGIGRLYAGQIGLGVTQLVLTLIGWFVGICGAVLIVPLLFPIAMWVWILIDGIVILSGRPVDGDGRPLRP